MDLIQICYLYRGQLAAIVTCSFGLTYGSIALSSSRTRSKPFEPITSSSLSFRPMVQFRRYKRVLFGPSSVQPWSRLAFSAGVSDA